MRYERRYERDQHEHDQSDHRFFQHLIKTSEKQQPDPRREQTDSGYRAGPLTLRTVADGIDAITAIEQLILVVIEKAARVFLVAKQRVPTRLPSAGAARTGRVQAAVERPSATLPRAALSKKLLRE